MRNFILTFALLINSGNFIFAQTSKDIASYYSYIYKSEKNIINKDYKAACQNYDSAFAQYVTPFGQDAYNCMLCALKTERYTLVVFCSKILVTKGVNISFFDKSIFHHFRATKYWSKFVKFYPYYHNLAERTIDTLVVKKLRELKDIDQNLTKQGYKNKNNTEIAKKIDSNYDAYNQLSIKNDFLSEEKVGITNFDTTIDFYHEYDVPITHSLEDHDDSPLFNTIKKSIHLGKIRSAYGLHFLNQYSKINYADRYYIFKDSLFYLNFDGHSKMPNILSENPNSEEKEIIDYCYIDSPKNIKKKIIFKFVNEFCPLCYGPTKKPNEEFDFQVGAGHISGGNLRFPFLVQNSEMIATCPY